jgi:hypothetical protein
MQNIAVQNLIVALIVVAAIAYAAWRFMPAALKLKLARMLGASEARAQKLGDSGACGSCSSCKACATPAEKNRQTLHLQK